jgi:hypothetical protein
MAKAKKLPGKHLLYFTLFGKQWDVREAPPKHRVFEEDKRGPVWAIVWLEDGVIYLRSTATREQKQTALLHEIQHIIEEHHCIDHTGAAPTEDESENRTDRLSLGWLYVIRGCPEVLAFVTSPA